MSIYRVQETTQLSDALRAAWSALWEKAVNANVFNSPSWYAMALEQYPNRETKIIACFRDDALVAITAIATVRVHGVPTWLPLCQEYVVEDFFLLAEDSRVLVRDFFSALFRNGNVLLPKIGSRYARQLHSLFPTLFVSVMSVNPYIQIGEDPLRFLSESNRKELEKLVRKNRDHFSFSVTQTSDQLAEAIKQMFAIDVRSGKQKKSMDIFSKEENKKLFSNFVKYCGEYTRIATLYFDGMPIAYIFNFIYKNYCLNYQTSYLNEYRKLRPGKIVILKMLEYAQEQGLGVFDFCGGISAYKQEFAKDYYVQYNMYWSKNLLVQVWWKLINTARRLNQVLFPIKNTRDHEFLFRTDLLIHSNPEGVK